MCFHGPCHCAQTAIDDNGRTNRLILNLELIRSDCPAINIKFADRKRYYDAFDADYRGGRVDDMVMLIGEYVSERVEKHLELWPKR